MHIIHLALGGCLRAPPVRYGITADTGGHIAYVLDAAQAQALMPGVVRVTILTRRFEAACLGEIHAQEREVVAPGVEIVRLSGASGSYLEKNDLEAELPVLAEAFCAFLAALPALPAIVHAHFADAAWIAREARRRFGVAFVYTPHALGIDKERLAGPEGDVSDGMAARIGRERAAIAAADAIVVSSDDEATRQIGGYGVAGARARTHRILPGVPVLPDAGADRGRAFLAGMLTAPERPMVLAVARPVGKKNLCGLVQAFAGDAALRAEANLVILAGQHDRMAPGSEGGREIAALRALRDRHDLGGVLALPTAHTVVDVAGVYRLAVALRGVFVNAALHEPYGLTLVEAASVGLPVVATCRGGPGEILGLLRHGILVAPEDRAAIARACRTVMGGRGVWGRLSRRGLRHAWRLDWGVYARRTVALYGQARRSAPAGVELRLVMEASRVAEAV